MADASNKPNILILGGVGFIGRNLVKYLVDNKVAKHIRVVDKVLPTVAYFGKEHQAALKAPEVKFKQGNAASPASLAKIFKLKNAEKFDYVINFASETKFSEPPIVYEEKIVEVAKRIIEECKKHKSIKRIIELSTAQVYGYEKKPSKEDGKIKPWTALAEAKLKAEKEWQASGLPVVIFRPVTVYGPGDKDGLMPRITIGRVYAFLDERMKFLWGGDMKINTVHVLDVARAIHHVLTSKDVPTTATYNLVDKNDTDQKKFNHVLESVFGIRTGFFNAIQCKLAKMNIKGVTEDVNDRHLHPWATLCNKFNIETTPISPYLAPVLLYDHNLSVDGSAIESTGFKYKYPNVTVDLIKEQVEYWVSQSVFPAHGDEAKAAAKSAGKKDNDSDDEEIGGAEGTADGELAD